MNTYNHISLKLESKHCPGNLSEYNTLIDDILKFIWKKKNIFHENFDSKLFSMAVVILISPPHLYQYKTGIYISRCFQLDSGKSKSI